MHTAKNKIRKREKKLAVIKHTQHQHSNYKKDSSKATSQRKNA
jgi:molybdopterin-guanine dinucleotide biosynthesis protein